MTGAYAYGMWPVAAVSIGIFIFFVLSYIKPKKRWEWHSMGTYSAFVVALFTEMYGVPLTFYILPRHWGADIRLSTRSLTLMVTSGWLSPEVP